jgi:predicted CXXCH cytochrome family protein
MTRPKPPKSTQNMSEISGTANGKIRMRPALLLSFFILAGLVIATFYLFRISPVAVPSTATKLAKPIPVKPVETNEYVGANVCKQCHQAEFEAWQGSHHDLAMQEANEQTVLGNFNNAKFKHHDVESTFFKRDGKFMVRTDGPDGKLTDYPITYTFGVTPLQQYLIAFPGGRYQTLSIAWDSRPKSEGGQRWFHLYPKDSIDHTDQLHWTGRYQNWNMECAECHSTHLKKGYNAATDSYETTFNELNVACESCHGPASQHIKWAKQAQPPYSNNDKGLAVKLQSNWQKAWKFPDSNALFAQREQLAKDELMNTCWACHARRSTLVEGSLPGLPLEDTHHPALLTQPAYYADGQQRDEDYTWGSFRQSKMFQKGVICMDCHEPHSIKLRAEGNALCTRCHNAAKFDSEQHHFHKPNSKGAQCMDCHAPEQNYMVIDGRHDHSFRLPRPDLSLSLGSPNACTQCHENRKPEWAAAAMDKWYGKVWRNRPHYGTTLHAGASQGMKALPALRELAVDSASPAIVRATALTLVAPMMQSEMLAFARQQLLDSDPSIRISALGLIESVDTVNRILAASPLLEDPIRGVRIEAARILADVPDSQIPSSRLGAFKSALTEYQDYLKLNADWPAENVNLGNLYMRQGNVEAAMKVYERSLALDPLFVGAYVNLADAYRQQGRDDEGEKQLRRGLSLLPDASDLHHALGLLLVRKTDQNEALKELSVAAKRAPENARYAYVYGIALNSAGKPREALAVLKAANARQPYDLDILSALISMQREAGDNKAALLYARIAAEALPDSTEIKQLIVELEGVK